jgi:hypothetical protein
MNDYDYNFSEKELLAQQLWDDFLTSLVENNMVFDFYGGIMHICDDSDGNGNAERSDTVLWSEG